MWYNISMGETLLLTDQSTPQTAPKPVSENPVFELSKFPRPCTTAHPGGPNWTFTPGQWLLACTLWEAGDTIRKACDKAGFEHARYYWAMGDFPELQTRHALARLRRANIMAEDTIDIADRAAADSEIDMAHVRAAESCIKARQWLIERHNPEEYGKRDTLNVNQRGVNVNIDINPGTNIDADKLSGALFSAFK